MRLSLPLPSLLFSLHQSYILACVAFISPDLLHPLILDAQACCYKQSVAQGNL